ncbi:MAG: hypothetical protein C4524_04600 [Candidatus Zixiibacteriota bacterium]|nr:MAG: hypothetical protein C4524_04600 [candidate division Zixibacteria bacterium]
MVKTWKHLLREDGTSLVIAAIMITMLMLTGLAFMKWGADENYEAQYEKYKLQAYYAAHAGIMDVGLQYLLSLDTSTLTQSSIPLMSNMPIITQNGQTAAVAENIWIQALLNQGMGAISDFNFVQVGAVGRVDFKDAEGRTASVRDTLVMTIKLLSLANFLYLTNHETTVFGEVIKFWSQDTLNGWVHSNDTITTMQQPVFYGTVSTTAPYINILGGNPLFLGGPPLLNYREIELPTEATEIRNASQGMGTFFDSENDQYWHRLIFKGNSGWEMYKWEAGQPFDTLSSPIATSGPPQWGAIFVNGYLELYGVVKGCVSVGAHGAIDPSDEQLGRHCIRLIDDIRYWCADTLSGNFDSLTTTDLLGIVSESHITIGNTWKNGRENGKYAGSATNMSRHSIIITAAMVALGESFSFEDQNDQPNFVWEFSTGYSGPYPDERGRILLRGAVTQFRRGYVHRSNHGTASNGTGYGKQYRFDYRLNFTAPPYFIEAGGEEGKAHFEVVSWGNE